MIIGLAGLAGCGKSTVANLIGPRHELAFADPMKRFCAEVFGFTREELYGPSAARETPSTRFTRPNGEPLTPRFALQTLGTEWGRNCDPDVWVKAGIARAQKLEVECDYSLPVVITDVRFTNEAHALREAGGLVWRIRRDADPNRAAVYAHASEREIWSAEFGAWVTHEVDNTGTLQDLERAVSAALRR
jgi:hypothetical protein